jgi:predicted DNA-binding helix-hairpin-helix protein
VEIKRSMGALKLGIDAAKPEPKAKAKPPKFAPAGQSTQMIVGADQASDGEILARSETLYGAYSLRRVYYSAFSPIPDAHSRLPLLKPPLMREHRLYQADWLMRFYGFERAEIAADGDMLDLEIDPKLAWALAHRDRFPVDVNRADRETLLRVPGLGVKSVDRLLRVRRLKRLELEDVRRLARSVAKLKPFIVAADWSPSGDTDRDDLRARLPIDEAPQQLSLF